jgi:hypothetical protein
MFLMEHVGVQPTFDRASRDLATTDLSQVGIEPVAVHEDIKVAFSGRTLGNLDPRFGFTDDEAEDPRNVKINSDEIVARRIKLAAAVGCDHLVTMVPQMSDGVHTLGFYPITVPKLQFRNWPSTLQPTADRLYKPYVPAAMVDLPADGLITRRPGEGLLLTPADCAPMVMYDRESQALALVHVGRAGANLNIAPKTLDIMRRTYGTDPAQVITYFGPSIAPESYVLPSLNEAMRREAWRPFLRETLSGYETDIVGYAVQRLLEQGVSGRNISRSPIDVATHPDYFSFTEHKRIGVPNGSNGLVAVIIDSSAAN